jgi:hypothetical protein
VRARFDRSFLVPGAVLGGLLLVVALVFRNRLLGAALGLGGATFVASVAGSHRSIDATTPLVAVLLLLCGELAGWSVDVRLRAQAEPWLGWRRAAAVALLALAGLGAATLVVVLGAAPAGHGLPWTIAGAAAAVAVAALGVTLARR